MTEEEGLKELCRRAANKNLYFNYKSVIGAPDAYIETVGGVQLFDFKELWGGEINYGREGIRDVWLARGELALNMIKKLLPRDDFKSSGKFRHAADVLSAATGMSILEIVEMANEDSTD